MCALLYTTFEHLSTNATTPLILAHHFITSMFKSCLRAPHIRYLGNNLRQLTGNRLFTFVHDISIVCAQTSSSLTLLLIMFPGPSIFHILYSQKILRNPLKIVFACLQTPSPPHHFITDHILGPLIFGICEVLEQPTGYRLCT